MYVKANTTGYFGGDLRHAGDVFEVPDDIGPASWFDPEPTAKAAVSTKPKMSPEQLDKLNAEKRAEAEKALTPLPPKVDYDPTAKD